MWIVRLALRRPYTFVVMALLIAILGVLTIAAHADRHLPRDQHPGRLGHLAVQRPVGAGDGGAHRHHLRARHDDDRQRHRAHRVAVAERRRHRRRRDPRLLPARRDDRRGGRRDDGDQPDRAARSCRPGTTPPFIIRYSATNVPILQLALQSTTLSEQQLYDYGLNFIRTQLATVQGAQVPLPFGGKTRQIMVDIDPDALYAKGLSAGDVSNALNAQNVILPAGTAKMGPTEYVVRTNSSPDVLEHAQRHPDASRIGGATVYLRDVAQVHDGFAVADLDGARRRPPLGAAARS